MVKIYSESVYTFANTIGTTGAERTKRASERHSNVGEQFARRGWGVLKEDANLSGEDIRESCDRLREAA